MSSVFHIVKICLLVASAMATIDIILVQSAAHVVNPRLLMASWVVAAAVFWIAGLCGYRQQ